MRLPSETDMEINLEDCEPAASPRSPVTSLTLTDDTVENKIVAVVREAHLRGFTVKSGFARTQAEFVAAAASMQLITTRLTRDLYGNEWQVTVKGLRWINEQG